MKKNLLLSLFYLLVPASVFAQLVTLTIDRIEERIGATVTPSVTTLCKYQYPTAQKYYVVYYTRTGDSGAGCGACMPRQLQLSDQNGDFTSPTVLTENLETDPHYFYVSRFGEPTLENIPGGNYKLRIRWGTVFSNSVDVAINAPAAIPVITPSFSIPSRYCYNTDYTFTHAEVPGATGYQWQLAGSNTGTAYVDQSQTGRSITLKIKSGSYISGIRVRAFNSCGEVYSTTFPISMHPDLASAWTAIDGDQELFVGEPGTYSVPFLPLPDNDIGFAWSYTGSNLTIPPVASGTISLTAAGNSTSGTLRVEMTHLVCPNVTRTLETELVIRKRRLTVSNGNWHDEATWADGLIPISSDAVLINHPVNLTDTDAGIEQLQIGVGGSLTINSRNLTVVRDQSKSEQQLLVNGGLVVNGGNLTLSNTQLMMGSSSSWHMSGGAKVFIDGYTTSGSGTESDVANIDFSGASGNLAGFTEEGQGGVVIIRRANFLLIKGKQGQHIRGNYQVGDGISNPSELQANEIRAYSLDRLTVAGRVNVYLLNSYEGNGPFYFTDLTLAKLPDGFSEPYLFLGYGSQIPGNPTRLVVARNLANNGRLTVNPLTVSSSGRLVVGGIAPATGTEYTPTPIPGTISGSGQFNATWVELMNQSGAVLSLGSNVTFTGPAYPDNACQCYRFYQSFLINNALINLNNYTLKSGTVTGTGRVITGEGAPLTVQAGSSTSMYSATFPVGSGVSSLTPLSIQLNQNGLKELSVGVSSTFSHTPLRMNYVRAEWDISGNIQPATATLKFTWNEADESPGFNRNDIEIARYNTVTADWEVAATGLSASVNPDGSFSVSVSGITQFSSWGVFDSGSVLPVKLVDFSAKKEGRNVLLSWVTSFESDSRHFEIQHTTNLESWQTLGRLNARGYSEEKISYAFTHANPVPGENLYRLKMVDNNGTFEYSRIRSVIWSQDYPDLVYIYPNPSSDRIFVDRELGSTAVLLQIYSADGKQMLSTVDVESGVSIQKLAAGIYTVRVMTSSGTEVSSKLVVYR